MPHKWPGLWPSSMGFVMCAGGMGVKFSYTEEERSRMSCMQTGTYRQMVATSTAAGTLSRASEST